ncbi:MAG: T9SS type A sorting domain-containing protein [Bacteroidota bacterium]
MKKFLPLLLMMLLSVSAFAYTPGALSDQEIGTPFLKEFSVYPNPTTGMLTLTLETIDENRPLEMKVYSLIGQEMYTQTITPFSGLQKMQLDLTKFPKGIYMVEISNGDKSRIKRVSVI